MSVPHFRFRDVILPVIRQTIEYSFAIGDVLRSKDVTEADTVKQAHAYYWDNCQRAFNPVIAKVMRLYAPELGLLFLNHGPAQSGGAFWRRVS